jgi:hypothetical protein
MKTHKNRGKKENETSQTVKHPLMGRPIVRPMYIGNAARAASSDEEFFIGLQTIVQIRMAIFYMDLGIHGYSAR